MKADLFESVDSQPVQAKDVVIPSSVPAFFVSNHNRVLCYVGVLMRNHDNPDLGILPYYLQGHHSAPHKRHIRGFLRLSAGCILLDKFIDERVSDSQMYYKPLDLVLRLPTVTTSRYGVEHRVTLGHAWSFVEDIDLTREVFGATYAELCLLLNCYASVLGISNAYVRRPSITRSLKSSNFCDITDTWIPPGFPYITLVTGDYDFGHVSLWGFYRHLGALKANGVDSPIGRLLMNAGAPRESLEHFRDVSGTYTSAIRVTRSVLYTNKTCLADSDLSTPPTDGSGP